MKYVLSVGQCGFDHSAIARFLGQHFDVKITSSATATEATRQLKLQAYDLILVNRQFDADGSEGLDFIRQLKAVPDLQPTPVMLVTNFREYAQQAETLGAVAGFGKSELSSPTLAKRLEPYLGPGPVSP